MSEQVSCTPALDLILESPDKDLDLPWEHLSKKSATVRTNAAPGKKNLLPPSQRDMRVELDCMALSEDSEAKNPSLTEAYDSIAADSKDFPDVPWDRKGPTLGVGLVPGIQKFLASLFKKGKVDSDANKNRKLGRPVQKDLKVVLGIVQKSMEQSKNIPEDASISLTEALDHLNQLEKDIQEHALMKAEEEKILKSLGSVTAEQLWEEKEAAEVKAAEAETQLRALRELLAKVPEQIMEAQDKAQKELQAAIKGATAEGAAEAAKALAQLGAQRASLEEQIATLSKENEQLALTTNKIPGPEEIAAQRVANDKLKEQLRQLEMELASA